MPSKASQSLDQSQNGSLRGSLGDPWEIPGRSMGDPSDPLGSKYDAEPYIYSQLGVNIRLSLIFTPWGISPGSKYKAEPYIYSQGTFYLSQADLYLYTPRE